jgi:hypothetical protein
LRKLATKSIELFGALAVSAHQVADGAAPDETDAARRQDAEQGCSGVVGHAVFSKVVEVCSRRTQRMAVLGTRSVRAD